MLESLRASRFLDGLLLALYHPEVPTCAECQTWLYSPGWKQTERKGEPVRRPRGAPLPCRTCPKSGDGKPHPEREFTAQDWRTYEYALQCLVDNKGVFPQDRATVRRNALVASVRNRAALATQQTQSQAALLMATLRGLGGGR